MIQSDGDAGARAQRSPWLKSAIAAVAASAVVAGAVAFAVVRYESRTNTQQVDLRQGFTITESSAIVQAAAKAQPAVVSIITAQQPTLVYGSGYLITSDGYIVTNTNVIAGNTSMIVLVPGDAVRHDARLVDYDCETGVAVVKIDQVSGLPTLSFVSDPTALADGQTVIAVGGPLGDGETARGIVSARHRTLTVVDPIVPARTRQLSDTIATDARIGAAISGGPLLNVGAQVIGIAMQARNATATIAFGLNAADVQDDVQQILTTGQVVVASLGASTVDVSPPAALAAHSIAGSLVVAVEPGSPAETAGLRAGDVITQMDDLKIDSANPLSLALRHRFPPNHRVTVTYSRGTASTQIQLTLRGQHPSCA